MQIAVKIQNLLNRLFRDEAVAVSEPREWIIQYKDVGTRLEGYIVDVTYKYAGKQSKYFNIDNDHFLLVSKSDAFNAASRFCSMIREKIKQNENIK